MGLTASSPNWAGHAPSSPLCQQADPAGLAQSGFQPNAQSSQNPPRSSPPIAETKTLPPTVRSDLTLPVGSDDRISDLPEDIFDHIISFLPTEDAVRSSLVVSKR